MKLLVSDKSGVSVAPQAHDGTQSVTALCLAAVLRIGEEAGTCLKAASFSSVVLAYLLTYVKASFCVGLGDLVSRVLTSTRSGTELSHSGIR